MNTNDGWNQYFKTINYTDEEKKLRESEIKSCEHEFVVIKRGKKVGNSTNAKLIGPYIECVHCGLTNKFGEYDEIHNRNLFHNQEISYEEQLFKEIYYEITNNYYSNSVDISKFNMISEEELITNHPRMLYKLACEICGEDEEIFDIMQKLSLIEREEKNANSEFSKTDNLVTKYYEVTGKAKVKKI